MSGSVAREAVCAAKADPSRPCSDEEDEEEDDEDDDDDEIMTEAERMEEGRRMFQIFAARMFEQRVLTAYREKVRGLSRFSLSSA